MTIVKVAKHAGVSTATVSRVLNNFPHVGAETARQVRASAEALNYTIPATYKRARSRGIGRPSNTRRRTNSIAILTIGQTRDWLQLPVMAAAVAGISRAAREHGLRLVIDEQLNLAKLPDSITNHGADGAIVFVPNSANGATPRGSLESLKKHLPIVRVMGGATGVSVVDHICTDHQAIGCLALEFLRKRGCQHVAFLTMDPVWHLMRTRCHAFAGAAYDNHIAASSYLLGQDAAIADLYGPRTVVDNTLESLVARLVNSNPRPTGLFVSNDAATVQVYPLLQQMGVQPDRDITIVSCDNEDIRLCGLNPRPASIDPRSEEVGWRAVRQLMSRLKNADEPPIHINVTPWLIVPDSTSDHAAGATA
jgi:LacI family transcriptional regulator